MNISRLHNIAEQRAEQSIALASVRKWESKRAWKDPAAKNPDMEQSEFSLREWGLKARMISRENTISRRYSASHIRSFREDPTAPNNNYGSFRSHITISSTASSPGYPSFKDEIDPSTYSFTTALKALQAKSSYNCWECLSPDGFALNSKWNDAEKYICNPLSGEVPMECLSAKTLSGRSFRHYTNRITMSAPLVYSSSNATRPFHTNKPSFYAATSGSSSTITHETAPPAATASVVPLQEKKMEMRDVGIQSTTPELSSSSPSPTSTPTIVERSLKRCEDSPNLTSTLQAKEEEDETKDRKREEERKEEEKRWRSRSRQGGCLSWMRKRMREKHKSRKKNIHNVADAKN